MNDAVEMIAVEVAYALPNKQKIIGLKVPRGTTAMEAAKKSGIGDEFPDLDIQMVPMGIFGLALGTQGRAGPENYVLEEGDRVELYRPLIADPKVVRRQRAEEARRKRTP